MDLKSLPFCAVLTISLLLAACNKKATEVPAEINPAAAGFDLAHSDPAAVELADSIMAAMGGRAAWDEVRFISWEPEPGRTLVWDKHAGRIRMETQADSTIVLLNVRTGTGRVRSANREITQPDSLRKSLSRAKKSWSNDSLWLVLPFNLKGNGITLRYLGEDTLMAEGTKCNLLELALDQAQVKDRYLLFVDLKDNLIKQWAYVNNPQEKPVFIRPWDNYKKYGSILLSADRTDHIGPKGVRIMDQLAGTTFTEF